MKFHLSNSFGFFLSFPFSLALPFLCNHPLFTMPNWNPTLLPESRARALDQFSLWWPTVRFCGSCYWGYCFTVVGQHLRSLWEWGVSQCMPLSGRQSAASISIWNCEVASHDLFLSLVGQMFARRGHLDGSNGTLNMEWEVEKYRASWRLSMRQGHDGAGSVEGTWLCLRPPGDPASCLFCKSGSWPFWWFHS